MDSKVNKKYNPCIVPTSLIKACARALQSGLDKGYRPQSYLDGDIEVYKNALYRHLLSYLDGNYKDKESGLNTLDHIVANVCILIELEERRPKEEKDFWDECILDNELGEGDYNGNSKDTDSGNSNG